MNILQKIFTDHFEEMLFLQHPRDSVIENVEKIIHCGDPSFGGAMYAIDWTTPMSLKIINVQHRHCVFTIARELRPLFLSDRSLLNCLFPAVNSVVTRMFHKENRSEPFTPGFICVLHTFGRDLKWNPHIHADHKNGLYVRAMPDKCNPSQVIKYIGRYLGRPVIASSRIDSYDGESATFHYNRHEDEKLVTETIPVLDLIARLTQHIPEKHFKLIRYHGIYARHRKSDRYLHRAISREKHKIFLSFNRWRDPILHSSGYDPLKCPSCGTAMLFLELYSNHKPVPLHGLYERAMRKHRCRPPAAFSSLP